MSISFIVATKLAVHFNKSIGHFDKQREKELMFSEILKLRPIEQTLMKFVL